MKRHMSTALLAVVAAWLLFSIGAAIWYAERTSFRPAGPLDGLTLIFVAPLKASAYLVLVHPEQFLICAPLAVALLWLVIRVLRLVAPKVRGIAFLRIVSLSASASGVACAVCGVADIWLAPIGALVFLLVAVRAINGSRLGPRQVSTMKLHEDTERIGAFLYLTRNGVDPEHAVWRVNGLIPNSTFDVDLLDPHVGRRVTANLTAFHQRLGIPMGAGRKQTASRMNRLRQAGLSRLGLPLNAPANVVLAAEAAAIAADPTYMQRYLPVPVVDPDDYSGPQPVPATKLEA